MNHHVNDLVYCNYDLLSPEEALARFLSLVVHPDAVRERRAFLEAVCNLKPTTALDRSQEAGGPQGHPACVSARATTLTDELLDDILRNGLSSSDEDRQVISRLLLDSEALGDLHAAVWNASPDNTFWREKVEAFLASRHEELLYSAAGLFAERGWSTARIAKKLRVPRRHVAGLLREARRRDILVVAFNREPRIPAISPSVALSGRWSYDELLSGLRAWSEVLQGVTVVASAWDGRPPEETTREMWARRMKDFGRCAGDQLRGLLVQAKLNVGVASGETVYWSIEGMPAADAGPARVNDTLKCIATVGDLACEGNMIEKILASNLANRLSQILTGREDAPCETLRTVAAFIPMVRRNPDGHRVATESDQADAIVDYLREFNDSYRTIFGGPGLNELPLIENLDAILTSCGSADQPNKLWVNELTDGGVSMDKMSKLSEGDIGGAPLKKPGLSDRDTKEFNAILRHWTGIKEEHFRLCAKNALSPGGGPGVVLVALGSNKLTAVLHCIRLGLVNHLFIDLDLAQALFKELRHPEEKMVSTARA
jgi:DNA-binding transcriptional regulator LsrR (DeoR family)